jgi:hypothetical protein
MSTAIASLFGKGINKHFNLELPNYPAKYTQLFHTIPMSGRILDMQGWETYGPPTITQPLTPVHMDEFRESFSKRFFPIKRTLGDVIAEEDWEDDQYGVTHRVVPGRGGAAAKVFVARKETDAVNLLGVTGFSSASPVAGSPDGVSLFSTAHPISLSNNLTTASNTPSTQADLSHTTYYAAYANLVQQLEPNNFNIMDNGPAKLWFNPKQRQVANQIARGDWERDTSQFQMNAAVLDRLTLVEWPYWRITGATSAANSWNAWGVEGRDHSIYFADRQPFKAKSDYDINVQGFVFVSYVRYDLGWSDWRGVYASKGS